MDGQCGRELTVTSEVIEVILLGRTSIAFLGANTKKCEGPPFLYQLPTNYFSPLFTVGELPERHRRVQGFLPAHGPHLHLLVHAQLHHPPVPHHHHPAHPRPLHHERIHLQVGLDYRTLYYVRTYIEKQGKAITCHVHKIRR